MEKVYLTQLILFCFSNLFSQVQSHDGQDQFDLLSNYSIELGVHYNAYFGNRTLYPNKQNYIDPIEIGDRDSIRIISSLALNTGFNYVLTTRKGFMLSVGVQYVNRKNTYNYYGDSLTINPIRPAISLNNISNHGISTPFKLGYSYKRIEVLAGINILLFEIYRREIVLTNDEQITDKAFKYKKLDISQRIYPLLSLQYDVYNMSKYRFQLFVEGQMRQINYYDILFGLKIIFSNKQI